MSYLMSNVYAEQQKNAYFKDEWASSKCVQ